MSLEIVLERIRPWDKNEAVVTFGYVFPCELLWKAGNLFNMLRRQLPNSRSRSKVLTWNEVEKKQKTKIGTASHNL